MGKPFWICQHREWEFSDNVSNNTVVVLKMNQISSPRSCLVFLVVADSQNGQKSDDNQQANLPVLIKRCDEKTFLETWGSW
jgi:hypothetical protein